MIVVDASTLIDLLFMDPVADRIMDRIYAEDERLAAPHVIDLEIAHVVRRRLLRGEIDGDRAWSVMMVLDRMSIDRYAHDVLLPRIWELRRNFTAYDAAYVALAEVLDAPLVTRDRRLSQGSGHVARIEYIE